MKTVRSICLEGFEVCGEARVMPCKHRFHSACIENWLRVRWTCPLCRFVMPLECEDLEEEKERVEERKKKENSRVWIDISEFGEFWIHISLV